MQGQPSSFEEGCPFLWKTFFVEKPLKNNAGGGIIYKEFLRKKAKKGNFCGKLPDDWAVQSEERWMSTEAGRGAD